MLILNRSLKNHGKLEKNHKIEIKFRWTPQEYIYALNILYDII